MSRSESIPEEHDAAIKIDIAVLEKISGVLSVADDIDSLIQGWESIITEIIEVEYSGFYIIDPQSGKPRIIAATGFTDEERLEAERTAPERHPGQVMRTRKTILVHDTLIDAKNTVTSKRSFKVRSRVFMPIVHRGESIGSIGLASSRPNTFNQGHVSVLSFMAQLIGTVYMRLRETSRRRVLEEQLRHSQKMESIGRLAGGIAHDFNNNLTVIQGMASVLKESLEDDPEAQQDLQTILHATSRAAHLTSRLLTFSRKEPRVPQPIEPHTQTHQALAMLRRLLREDIKLNVDIQPTKTIFMDPTDFEQIILNLASNAADAMAEGGTMTLRTAPYDGPWDPSPQLWYPPEVKQPREGASYTQITLTDTGIGIDAKTLKHIFEPFFTTKASGAGTGLGLAAVFNIVQDAEGRLAVWSQPGQGTTFRLLLPNTQHKHIPRTDEHPSLNGSQETYHERILLIEDDNMIRRMLSRALKARGYDTHVASNGAEALRMLETLSPAPDLLISDIIMPQLNGLDLKRALDERAMVLPILFISGYTNDLALQREFQSLQYPLLRKPFTLRKFFSTIRQLLDNPT